jgi:hypothetical protein
MDSEIDLDGKDWIAVGVSALCRMLSYFVYTCVYYASVGRNYSVMQSYRGGTCCTAVLSMTAYDKQQMHKYFWYQKLVEIHYLQELSSDWRITKQRHEGSEDKKLTELAQDRATVITVPYTYLDKHLCQL